MAVLGRLLVSSAERLDLPDLLSLDSYAAGDWKYFLKGLVGDSKPYILKGFDVIDPANAIGTQSCSIRVADSVTFYPGSNSGSFFHGLQEGHAQAAPLVPELRKNAVNYVYLTFSTFNTSVDTRAFWDPDKDGGAGGEFTQDINTQSVLKVDVNVSTGSFPANTVPVAKITVGPVVITAIEDARDMMFRLGSGGINPNPFNTYSWRSLPGSGFTRSEPPTQMLAGGTNPFQGADKNILTLKEWMDAVMSKLRELGGTTYWYDDTSSFSIVGGFYDALATAFKSKGKWTHDSVTPGLTTWSEDIQIKLTSDPRTYIIRQGSKTIADEQVMYLAMQRNKPFNTTDENVQWINGQSYVNTIGGSIGLFANLSKGDYVKKANDTIDKWVRVEEFYDAVNLGGSVTTAANARSVRLGSAYLGTTAAEKGRYDKGVYLPADIVVSDRNQAAIGNAGGQFHWLAIRSDTIENVGNIATTSLSVAIDQHDGSTARVTAAAHGLVDGDRVTITGTTNFNGIFKVEVETPNIFYIAKTGGVFADESGTARYATVTTVARSTPYGLQEESANHGFNADDNISIAGTTNYNGDYEINVRSSTQFTIPVSNAAGAETVGTARLARVIVRTEGAVAQIIQGQTVDIGGSPADNLRQYVGMASLSETAPTYSIASSYNTLDGMTNWNAIANESLTARVSKLSAMMADKAQDKMIRALPSAGIQSVNNTTSGSAQQITFTPAGATLTLMTPGSTGQCIVNLPSSAPGISLLVNQVAYVLIDRNDPTTGTIVVSNIASAPVDENAFLIAARLSGQEVYLWEGSIIATGSVPGPGFNATIVKQNQMLKLVEGGTWSWNLATQTLTWSAPAYVQVPGLANSANSIAANSIVLAAGQVAYININRVGAGGALTPVVASNASLVTTTDQFILARREGSDVVVGLHSMRLVDGQSQKLYATASNETLSALGLKSEADKGMLRLLPTIGGASKRIIITPIDTVVFDGTTYGNEISGLRMKFAGAQIDMQTGQHYGYGDGTVAGAGALIGTAFTPAAFTSPNLYRWYSINLVADTMNADGTMNVKPLILAGADGSGAATAVAAPFSSKKLGQVLVQATGTGSTLNNITQSSIVQLATGAGSGGSGAAPKLIGGGTFTSVVVDGFNIGTGFNSSVNTATTQPDKKILVGGNFTAFNGNTRNRLVRLNGDGSEDLSFGANLGSGFDANITSIQVQPNGKILVGGGFTTYNGNPRNRLVRLNADGTEDTAFYTNLGTSFDSQVNDIRLQSTGKIVVIGGFNNFNGNGRVRIVRLNSDGTEDAAFYSNIGPIFGGMFNGLTSLAIQSDDKVVVVGGTAGSGTLNRRNADGTADTAFNSNIGAINGNLSAIAIYSDGKIIVGGDFTTYNGNTRNRIFKLNSDGTEDTAFYANAGTAFSSLIRKISIDAADRVVVLGQYGQFNSLSRLGIVRLNSDGTEDAAFYSNLGSAFISTNLFAVHVQPLDQKILVGGLFSTLNGNPRNNFVRLQSSGLEDGQTSGSYLSFTQDIYVEQPRLSYASNRINSAVVSPISLPTTNHVAYIERLNASAGGPDLTVLVDQITNVKDGQIIIARRDGDDFVVGSSSTRLAPGESKKLYAALSDQNRTFIGATGPADSKPQYASNNFIVDDTPLTEAISTLDASLQSTVSSIRWKQPVANFSALPTSGNSDGDVRLTLDSRLEYQWKASASAWQPANTLGRNLPIIGGGTISSASVAGTTTVLQQTTNSSDVVTSFGHHNFNIHRYGFYYDVGAGGNTLSKVTFKLRNSGFAGSNSSEVRVDVLDNNVSVPGSVIGTSGTLTISTPAGVITDVVIPFVSPISVAANSRVYIVLTARGSVNGTSVNFYGSSGGSDNQPNSGIVFTDNGGTSWNIQSKTNAIDPYYILEGTVDQVSLSFSAPLNVEVPGLSYSNNVIQTSQSPILFTADQQVAYVIPNTVTGGPSLTVQTAALNAVPTNGAIIARRDGVAAIINNTRFLSGESKSLNAGVSDQILSVIPASSSADSSGQLRLLANPTSNTRVNVSAASKIVPDGTEYGMQLKNLLLEFSGAQIDFSTGILYKEDGTTPLGINFTPAPIAANQYRWHSVTLIPSVVAGTNKIGGQLVVIPAANDGSDPVLAPKAAFAGSGIKLGQVVVQRMNDGINIAQIPQYNIIQLTATGGGDGSGDANELLERIKDRLVSAPFDWVEPNIFLQNEDKKIASATATYDVANTLYKFTAAGQNITSIQSLDAEFLGEEKDVSSIELMTFWNPGKIDANATYEVSRNGGTSWHTVTMERIGSTSDTFRGIFKFSQTANYITLHEWALGNNTAYRELNTTALQAIGQKFVVTNTQVIQRPTLYINKVGSPAGWTYVQLVRDNGSDKPSTNISDIVAQAQVMNSTLASGDNAITLEWGTIPLKAGTYHFVISTDSNYKSGFTAAVNSVRARVDAVAPIGPFGINELNSGAWTTNSAQTLIHKIEGRPLDLRVRITSSASSVELKGYGIFYGRHDLAAGSLKNREVVTFNGTTNNLNEFTLSNFLPDPDLLRVYHVQNGQVYVHGIDGFLLNGSKVVFPANTFNGLDTVTLVFDQLSGTSFDNSDANAALLNENRLGSTNPSIDRSVAGQGLLLRADNGKLVEASLTWNGSGYEWLFAEVT